MNFVQTLTAVEKSRALSCAIRFLLAAILSGSQIFGAYAPFGLGFVAAAAPAWRAFRHCWAFWWARF